MILVNEVKGRIKAKKYTLEEVAENIGITYKTLNRRFKKGILSSDEVNNLMEVLEIKDPRPIFFFNVSLNR